ncbi:diguanylate cyclase [Desulfoluna butyratoxydans]|uniref:diguanylate cyclase n=1 Tax=Desulfoluna butyratoxydans TaxID=231438 RepID=A0A4U8YWS7_9BACT|nr:diguanylate cyclase [Desulfoluna butyratoxydans]VFQ46482.1 nucleotide cyclase [Desulfoluna butyratoxydans]
MTSDKNVSTSTDMPEKPMRIKKFSEWQILSKIMAISIISVALLVLVILGYFMPLAEKKMLAEKKEGLKNVVDTTFGMFQEYADLIREGKISKTEAKKQFARRLRPLRFSENSYFWINDVDSTMVMHPIMPELEGKNLNDRKDTKGNLLFQDFLRVSKANGAGYVDYMWAKAGKEKPVPKLSYVRLYEPWGWILGSGIYIDDVYEDINQLRLFLLTSVVLFATLTITLAVFIGTGITRPLQKVIEGLQDIAGGKGRAGLTKRIAITSIDEIGMLSTEFNSLMDAINSLAVFKNVIEEDDSLEEVYQRLGDLFTQTIGIPRCFIFQVVSSKSKLELTYPGPFDREEMVCAQQILDDNSLCKAKRTGHLITSTHFPAVCRQFDPQAEEHHYCIPIVVGGATVAVVQLLFPEPIGQEEIKERETKLFKAEQYINESLAVIETKRLMNSLQDAALIDPLTGLYNRRYLQEYTEKIVAGVLRRGKNIGLIMCDLDYFKQVNDTYGHHAGDLVLQETAKTIAQSVRDSDIVIRFGGEEFLVVLLDINDGESIDIAEKIRLKVQQVKFRLPDGVIQKTISLGASEFPKDTDTLWSCIKYADVALYRAKEEGRNRCIRFLAEMWTEDQI